MATEPHITVAGAGILGLWQALTLARDGHRVRLIEQSAEPFAQSASVYAGAMLSPDCEGESAPALVSTLGHEGLALWRENYAGVIANGSLVVAAARDQPDAVRFEKQTKHWQKLRAEDIARLEPELADRFPSGLFFADEAHVVTPDATVETRAACPSTRALRNPRQRSIAASPTSMARVTSPASR